MKKILVVCILAICGVALLFVKKEVSISYDKNLYHNNEIFDALDINIKNHNNDMIIEVEGLDLIGFTKEEINNKKGYLKEFGLYTIVYKVYLNEELVCIDYREINCYIYQSDINNLIINNDFSANLYKWNMYDETNGLEYSVLDNELIIKQNNTGNNFWDQKLSQYITLKENSSYILSFDLYSTSNKEIEVSIYQELHDAPWTFNYGLIEYIVVTDEKKTYDFEFICTKPSELDGFLVDINNIKLEFKFGYKDNLNNNNSTLYFSNLSLIKNDI